MLGRPHQLHLGETGQATWRTFTIGELRARLVEYSAGYTADHCCDLGHVLYVVEGELDTELRDGRTFKLRAWYELPSLRSWRCGTSLVNASGRQTLHR